MTASLIAGIAGATWTEENDRDLTYALDFAPSVSTLVRSIPAPARFVVNSLAESRVWGTATERGAARHRRVVMIGQGYPFAKGGGIATRRADLPWN